MTLAKINDIQIHYQLEGDKDAPVLMLCNSLGTTLEMRASGSGLVFCPSLTSKAKDKT